MANVKPINKNLKTNSPPPPIMKNRKCHPTPPLGSFILGFLHLGPEASEKTKTAKTQRETASKLKFRQDKVKAINKSLRIA